MAAGYAIAYHPEVVDKDIPALPKTMARRIVKAIRARLETEPEMYGNRLRKSLQGYWKLRVGDYRVVFALDSRTRTVHIGAIDHRKSVYDAAMKRLMRS